MTVVIQNKTNFERIQPNFVTIQPKFRINYYNHHLLDLDLEYCFKFVFPPWNLNSKKSDQHNETNELLAFSMMGMHRAKQPKSPLYILPMFCTLPRIEKPHLLIKREILEIYNQPGEYIQMLEFLFIWILNLQNYILHLCEIILQSKRQIAYIEKHKSQTSAEIEGDFQFAKIPIELSPPCAILNNKDNHVTGMRPDSIAVPDTGAPDSSRFQETREAPRQKIDIAVQTTDLEITQYNILPEQPPQAPAIGKSPPPENSESLGDSCARASSSDELLTREPSSSQPGSVPSPETQSQQGSPPSEADLQGVVDQLKEQVRVLTENNIALERKNRELTTSYETKIDNLKREFSSEKEEIIECYEGEYASLERQHLQRLETLKQTTMEKISELTQKYKRMVFQLNS